MLVIARVAVPVLVRVMLWGLLLVPTACEENVKELGERLTTAPAPVPVRLMVWVPGLALSEMRIEPVSEPVSVGVKVTLSVQVAPGARLLPQLLVWEKSPLAVILEIVRVPLPLFARAIASGELVAPTTTLPRSNDDGVSTTKGIAGALISVTKAS